MIPPASPSVYASLCSLARSQARLEALCPPRSRIAAIGMLPFISHTPLEVYRPAAWDGGIRRRPGEEDPAAFGAAEGGCPKKAVEDAVQHALQLGA
jgi:hypothetical protein